MGVSERQRERGIICLIDIEREREQWKRWAKIFWSLFLLFLWWMKSISRWIFLILSSSFMDSRKICSLYWSYGIFLSDLWISVRFGFEDLNLVKALLNLPFIFLFNLVIIIFWFLDDDGDKWAQNNLSFPYLIIFQCCSLFWALETVHLSRIFIFSLFFFQICSESQREVVTRAFSFKFDEP